MRRTCPYREQDLLPQVKAIIILDEDGGRVSCKYHDRVEFPNLGAEAMFEHKLFRKTKSVSSPTSATFRVCSPREIVNVSEGLCARFLLHYYGVGGNRVLPDNLVGLGFLYSVSYVKSFPTHEKIIAVGKSGPNATFSVFFLGLGWPWVGEFVGSIIVFILVRFPTHHNLVNRTHTILGRECSSSYCSGGEVSHRTDLAFSNEESRIKPQTKRANDIYGRP